MSSAPRPGWYRDPAGTPGSYRWWDGRAWTEELGDSAQAPAPAAASADRPAAEDHPELRGLDLLDDGPAAPVRHGPVRRAVAVVVIVALFAATGIGVAVLFWRDSGPNRTESGSGAAGPSNATSPDLGGQLDERTRTATIDSASMTLPDDPYVMRSDPVALRDVFDEAFTAEATVHDDYAGRQDWSSMVAFAAIDPSLVPGGDLTAGGSAALARLSRLLYGNDPTVTDVEIDDHAVDGRSGVMVTAKVHYRIAHLPSRYDAVHALFVRLDNGTVIAALTSVPDDASSAVRAQAQQSLDSLTVR